MVERVVKFKPMLVERVDIVETNPCLREDVLDPWMVERVVKFKPILVERVDIVETNPCLREDVFEPIVVERVETENCRVDRLDPAVVESRSLVFVIYV
jgi:hypothetical protein